MGHFIAADIFTVPRRDGTVGHLNKAKRDESSLSATGIQCRAATWRSVGTTTKSRSAVLSVWKKGGSLPKGWQEKIPTVVPLDEGLSATGGMRQSKDDSEMTPAVDSERSNTTTSKVGEDGNDRSPVLAMECEMETTTSESEVARISIVDRRVSGKRQTMPVQITPSSSNALVQVEVCAHSETHEAASNSAACCQKISVRMAALVKRHGFLVEKHDH